MIKLLIVENQPTFRIFLREILEKYPDIEILNYIEDLSDFDSIINKENPDLILINVDLLNDEVIEKIKRLKFPCIVLITTGKSYNIQKVFELSLVDFIKKPEDIISQLDKFEKELIDKIRSIKDNSKKGNLKERKIEFIENSFSDANYKAVVIGASTGGPPALQEILPKFPGNFPLPIIVAQHMPGEFTKHMAERLNKLCALNVLEAKNGERIEKGNVYIGKGGYHILVEKINHDFYIKLTKDPKDALYHPQIDLLFESAAKAFGKDVIAVILTGMGSDGVKGLKLLKQKGAYIIAQDKDSCAVFGMPRVAIESGVVDKVLPLQEIPNEIIRRLS